MNTITSKTAFKERKPPTTPKFQPKVIPDSNLNCRINPDPDVCRISPKMLWIYYLIGVSHFAKFRKNRAVTGWKMLTNLLKSPDPRWWGRWKSHPESVSGTRAPPKVNQFFRLVDIKFQWNRLVTFSVILLIEWHTDRSTDDHITPPC